MICASYYEASLFHTASLLAFFGALQHQQAFGSGLFYKSQKALSLKYVFLSEFRLQMQVRSSETDQSRKGIWISLEACKDAELSPVVAFDR